MRPVMAWMVVGLLLVSGAGLAVADGLKPATRISHDLAELVSPRAAASSIETDEGVIESPMTAIPDVVTIDAVASGDPAALEDELIALGAQDTAIAGRMVSARIPLAAIPFLDGVASLQFARAAQRVTNVGLVTSQGDKVMRADIARGLYGVDGTGVVVGVLSDSYNCLFGAASDMVTGDLPATVTVLQESSCGPGARSDEGRAMLQIVHDVAPGASLAFATAFGGQAGFANNIIALRNAGAKVIVDDVGYFAAPMFQDGVIAQAVDSVKASGVAYFSSAGNQARQAYEHAFVPGQVFAPGAFAGLPFLGGTAHNFGGTAMQRISIPAGTGFTLALQWDSPFFSVSGGAGTPNDLDIYILQNNVVVRAATTNNLVSKDPVEVLSVGCSGFGTCVASIMIVNHAGPVPGRFKFVFYGASRSLTLTPALNSGTIVGHANALGAVAVGASNYKTPTTLEPFSSGGTTPILFDTLGNRLGTPDLRQFKPEIVAPDGANTTFFSTGVDPEFDGFPNFFGTSAAAPHAAGVAALMLQGVPALPPETLRNTLENTALNMGPAGFDVNTGFGLIRADAALAALHTLTITAGPGATPNPAVPGGTVNVSVDAVDSFGHALTYAWTSTCTGLGAAIFDNPTLQNPTWTAPANATGATQTCVLKVTVNDGHGTTKSGSVNEAVLSVPKVTTLTPAAATVGTTVTIAGMALTGSTLVTFSGGATAVPTTVTPTSLQVVVPVGALTGTLSVTNPAGAGASATAFKVLPKIVSFTPPAVVGGSASTVTVSGTNLKVGAATPTVKVGAVVVPIGSILSSSLTELTFMVPPGATTGKISITTIDGTATSATNLVVILPPKPTSFVPAMATVGTEIVINGTALAVATSVTFAGSVTATPTAVTATSLHVVVPAGAVTGPVTVFNPAGNGSTTARFKVLPKITSFTPASAVGGSATVVTVSGFNLKVGATTPAVKIGTFVVPAGSITSSATELTFTVPLGAVNGKIMVTTVDGTAASATDLIVVQPPRATTFAPASAVVGTDIAVTGTNMANTTLVTFTGGATAVPTAVTATSLHVVVPAGALSGPVSVTNPIGTAASAASFKVLPKITGFSPSSAVGGSTTVITVDGFNLKVGTTTPTVKVGTFVVPPASIQSSTPTQLTFTVPLGAVSGKISITTVDGTATSAVLLTVIQPPRVTAFAPAAAVAGTDVVITGTNLTETSSVIFSGAIPAAPTAVTATSMHVVVPVGAVTGPVIVTNPIASTTSALSFKVAPKLTSFDPPSVIAGSPTPVNVVGLNLKALSGEPTVKVGTFVIPGPFPGSQTGFSFLVPLGAVTGKISITTVDGATTSATALTVNQPPRVVSFTPTAAVAGTDIVISGTSLTGASLVIFTGMQTVTPTAVIATSLHAKVPPDAASGPITVQTPNGFSTSVASFKVLPRIIGFTPASGAVGDEVVVTGTSLRLLTDPIVKVGAVAATVTSSTRTELRFTIPLGAVTGKITVTTADGTATSATSLTVTP